MLWSAEERAPSLSILSSTMSRLVRAGVVNLERERSLLQAKHDDLDACIRHRNYFPCRTALSLRARRSGNDVDIPLEFEPGASLSCPPRQLICNCPALKERGGVSSDRPSSSQSGAADWARSLGICDPHMISGAR